MLGINEFDRKFKYRSPFKFPSTKMVLGFVSEQKPWLPNGRKQPGLDWNSI